MPTPLDLHPRDRPTRDHDGTGHRSRTLCHPRSNLLFPFLIVLLSAGLISCGGAGTAPATASVTVTPSSAQLFVGSPVQFSASVQDAGRSTVNWMVNSIPGGNLTLGTINASGLFTAPNSVPNPPTVAVTAILQSGSTQSAPASVTIEPLSLIQGPLSISPALSSVTTSQTLQLQITTADVSNTEVNWLVDGVLNGNSANGTITSSGLYTPPNSTGAHLIIAELQANPNALGSAQVEVTGFAGTFTWRNDNSRSGQNLQELALTPATVSSAAFGKIFSCPLDGNAYAQPLYVANLAIPGNGTHNVIFVATEMDSVFAFDADASPCVQLWHTSLIPTGEGAVQTPNLEITTANIAPFVGITGTPVIDLGASNLYVVAETWTAGLNPVYHQRLYALGLATGQPEIQSSGIQISTGASVNPAFSPLWGNQRAALLLENGTVYVAFASFEGQGDYHGWLMGYNASTMQQTSAFDDTPGGQGGGIWQGGGGPSADSAQNMYVATGNGTFDANLGGPLFNYGDSFLRLSTTGGLAVTGYFTPCNQATASADQDLGSSAPLLLPNGVGPAAYPNLLLGAAGNGSMYLVDRDTLGGYDGGTCPNNPPSPLQIVPVNTGPILSTPLFWNNAIFVASGNDVLKAFPMTQGVLATSPLSSQSPEKLGPQGATPVVSANGANNAIIWLIDESGALAIPNTPAILRAFNANNLSSEIYNSAMNPARDTAGLAVKFTVPTVANAKVYVGTQTELDVYGLLAQ